MEALEDRLAPANLPLIVTGSPLTATEGLALTNVQVATFSDANSQASPSDFPLGDTTINWGDGSASNATAITQPGGAGTAFDVFASHTYAEQGTYNPTITVQDASGDTGYATASVVGWWQGNGNANDSAGSDNGTLVNGVTFAPGEFGQAFDFNGVNQSVDLGTGASLSGDGDFAVEAWINTTASSGVILQQRGSGGFNGEYILTVGGDIPGFSTNDPGHITFSDYGGGQVGFDFASTKAVNDGQWHQIVAVREANGTGQIYIDGVLDSEQAASPVPLDSTIATSIGADVLNSDLYFNGLIEEVEIFNSGLSASDIKTINQAGAAGPDQQATVADAGLSATGTGVAATEGAALSNVQVGTLTDAAGTDSNPTDLSATINWGDGTATSLATLVEVGTSGKYTVEGSHTYAEAGSYSISVSYLDAGGSTATSTSTAPVADAPLSATGKAVAATEGAALSIVQVGTLSDAAGMDSKPSDLFAMINWGDNTQFSPATLVEVGTSGVYTVEGSHTYAEAGSYTISVYYADAAGSTRTFSSTTISSSTATVADAGLSATGTAVSATEGAAFSNVQVGTLTDAAGIDSNPSDLSATINWGDGTQTSAAILVESNTSGVYTVEGSHTYAEAGSYPIGVSYIDAGGSTTTSTSTATVADAGLSAMGTAVSATAGVALSNVQVGTLTDGAGIYSNPSDLSATITWGDGTQPSTATLVESGSSGMYTVEGSHTYTGSGSYTISVSYIDAGGSTATSTSTATVEAGPVAEYQIASPGFVTAGAPFTISVTPIDAFGNIDPSGLGSVEFTSTDPLATLPSSFDFTQNEANQDGTYTIPGFQLDSAGEQTISIHEGDETQSILVFVAAGSVAGYQIAPVGTVAPGVPFALTVTPVDAFGNINPSGLGIVSFTSSDALAILPAPFNFYPFNQEDTDFNSFYQGEMGPSGTFTIPGFQMGSSGPQTITLTTEGGTPPPTSTPVNVENFPPQDLTVSLSVPGQSAAANPPLVVVGHAFTLSGAFQDPDDYRPHTVTITSTAGPGDSITLSPTTITLPAGVDSFSVAVAFGALPQNLSSVLAEIQVTVTDASNGSISAPLQSIYVENEMPNAVPTATVLSVPPGSGSQSGSITFARRERNADDRRQNRRLHRRRLHSNAALAHPGDHHL